MRIPLFILSFFLLVSCSISTKPSYLDNNITSYNKNPRKANLEWFQEANYGMFIHYGLYSMLGKGEWVQLKDTIPVTEYAQLKNVFTAAGFDADNITDIAVKAGMQYITMTAKHHDGFCLFKTQETEFNSLNSPAKRDLIHELYAACESKGLGLFIYYSYALDWKHPYFYDRSSGWQFGRPAYTFNEESYLYKESSDFSKYIDYAHAQLREILTQYPNIAGIWLDPIMGYYHRPELFPIEDTYAIIRSLSPHALISFKQGANGTEDFVAPERGVAVKVGQKFDVARTVSFKNKNKPIEVCNTLQPHAWGYNQSKDGHHKKSLEVLQMLDEADKIDANLLLNVGPLGDGSFPEEDIKTLKEVGKIIKNR
ncbi:MAG: alpha-L-fucosidase [Flavicella sp.]